MLASRSIGAGELDDDEDAVVAVVFVTEVWAVAVVTKLSVFVCGVEMTVVEVTVVVMVVATVVEVVVLVGAVVTDTGPGVAAAVVLLVAVARSIMALDIVTTADVPTVAATIVVIVVVCITEVVVVGTVALLEEAKGLR